MPVFLWRLIVAISIPLVAWGIVWLLWYAANAVAD